MPRGFRDTSNGILERWLLAGVVCAIALFSSGCTSGRYTTMYLDRLVHERAEQEVKIETMSLDLEAAQNTIMTLEEENQRLREAGGELDAKPLKKRRVSSEPEAVPAIDKEPASGKPKEEASPTDELTSAPDSIPDLDIGSIEDGPSSPAVDAKQASLKRPDEGESAPEAAPDGGGEAFLPTKLGAPKEKSDGAKSNEEELPSPPSEASEPQTSKTAASSAASVVIDKTQTHGEDLDGKPGDEGVLVVLQPRDGSGKYIPEAASVLIELVDSPGASKSDPNAQVAEWKFTQEEVRRAMRNSTLGRGAYLQVDWDEHVPSHSKLLIIAHWKLPSGEVRTAQHVVKVNLSKGSQAWDSRIDSPIASDEPAASVATRPSTGAESTSANGKSWAPSRR